MNSDVFSLKIGGQAGQGIKSAGLLLAKFAVRSGYHVYDYIEYPSLIRGGHNVMQVNISSKEVLAPWKELNFLIALNQETLDLHLEELVPGSAILFDEADKIDTSQVDTNIKLCQVPLSKLAKECGGEELLSNTVALGAAAGLLGGSLAIFEDLIKEKFKGKGEDVVQTNLKSVEAGYNYVKEKYLKACGKHAHSCSTYGY